MLKHTHKRPLLLDEQCNSSYIGSSPSVGTMSLQDTETTKPTEVSKTLYHKANKNCINQIDLDEVSKQYLEYERKLYTNIPVDLGISKANDFTETDMLKHYLVNRCDYFCTTLETTDSRVSDTKSENESILLIDILDSNTIDGDHKPISYYPIDFSYYSYQLLQKYSNSDDKRGLINRTIKKLKNRCRIK